MTIASVASAAAAGTSVVTLTAPLKFQHFAGVVSYDGKEIDMRAEVGHLTRRVVVRGRGLHSFTSQLNLSRFGHTSRCPPV